MDILATMFTGALATFLDPSILLVVLEGTDHFSFLYKPVEFRNILRAFLGIGGAA